MLDSYFRSPRPFGQHSTSYRAMGGNGTGMRSASSLSTLPTSGVEDVSVQTMSLSSYTSANDSSLFASGDRSPFSTTSSVSHQDLYAVNPGGSRPSSGQSSVTSGSSAQRSGNDRWFLKGQMRDGRNNNLLTFHGPVSPPEARIFGKQKTTSMVDALMSDRHSPTPVGPQYETSAQIPLTREIPIQVEQSAVNIKTSAEPFYLRSRGQQPRSNVNPYHEEFKQRKQSGSNVVRAMSAVPFNDYTPSKITSAGSDVKINQDVESTRKIHHRTDAVEFSRQNAANEVVTSESQEGVSKVPSNNGRRIPLAFERSERSANYASLHHLRNQAPPRQRRTSDSAVINPQQDNPNEPSDGAMRNVALGVRAELEQDPKFRQRAESVNEHRYIRSPPGPHQHPKQSPSLQHMEHYFSHIQNMQNIANFNQVALSHPTSTSFTADDVHNIFRGPKEETSVHVSESPLRPSTEAQYRSTPALNIVIRTTDPVTPKSNLPTSVHTNETSAGGKEAAEISVPIVQVRNGGSDVGADAYRPGTATEREKNDIQKAAVVLKEYGPFSSKPKTVVITPINKPFPVVNSSPGGGGLKQPSSPPQSILLKSTTHSSVDNTAKPQKRVVFQCDADIVRRLNNKKAEQKNGFVVKDLSTQETPPAVRQYDDAVEEPLQKFIRLSSQIGGDVKLMGEKVASAFNEQRNFLWSAAGQKEVPASELPAKLSPIVKHMEEISTLRESKRNTPQFNHLSAVSEGIQALGWVTVKPAPAPFIKDMYEAAMFFVNRVLKEHKDGDKVHIEWAKAWTELLSSLQAFVKQIHTTGLVWNSSPGTSPPQSVGTATNSSGDPPPPPCGPPPPPPPPVLPPDLLSAKGGTTSDRAALFAEINKGEDITKGLKKVTADMQTHKNPNLRAHVVSADTSKSSTATVVAVSNKAETVKPPKTYLENGKQWNIEYHKNDQNIVLQITDMKQTVYVFKCENSVIQVKGKVNSITLDSCKKTSIVFDSLLSQVEVINCQGMQIQTLGAMPTLSIQKTDGCQVYLSKEALNAEIITSKSSSMNILVPAKEEGDFVEYPVPEQFKTVFDGKKLTTTVSDIV